MSPEPMRVFAGSRELGIDLDAVTTELQVEGVAAFADAFDQLLAALRERGPRRRG